LFVLIAGLACWLSYSLHWIHARHRFLGDPEPGVLSGVDTNTVCVVGTTVAPWQLRMFGVPGCGLLMTAHSMSSPEYRRMRSLFPEAAIRTDLGNGPSGLGRFDKSPAAQLAQP
jgi:hypothetical protein